MTDKELAVKYAECEQCAHCINPQYCPGKDDCYDFAKVMCHFLAGLKAGRHVWHNLMKDSNDLPNDDRFVLNEVGVRVFYLPSRHKWYYVSPVKPVINGIVAWCEVPTYKEE